MNIFLEQVELKKVFGIKHIKWKLRILQKRTKVNSSLLIIQDLLDCQRNAHFHWLKNLGVIASTKKIIMKSEVLNNPAKKVFK